MKDKLFYSFVNFFLALSILAVPFSFFLYVIFEWRISNTNFNPFGFLAYGFILAILSFFLYFFLSKGQNYKEISNKLEKENFYDFDFDKTRENIASMGFKPLNLIDELYVREKSIDKDTFVLTFIVFAKGEIKHKDWDKTLKDFYKTNASIKLINGLICSVEKTKTKKKVRKDYLNYDSSLNILSHFAFCNIHQEEKRVYYHGDRFSKKRFLILQLIEDIFKAQG